MLRKRILSAVLAAVLSVSSFSIASFADEEATSVVTLVKTQDELKEYIDSFDSTFLSQTLFDYGESSYLTFQKVFDYAKAVSTGAELEAEYTNAYYMLERAFKDLRMYSAAELAALVAKCKPVYTADNRLNDEDNTYDEDAFGKFQTAYLDAVDYSGSNSTEITDIYEALDSKYNDLMNKKLEVVTRAQFIALNKQVQNVLKMEGDYDVNRRGAIKAGDVLHSTDNLAIKWGMLFAVDTAAARMYLTGDSRGNTGWLNGGDNDQVNGTHLKVSSSYTTVNMFGAYIDDWDDYYDLVNTRNYSQISNVEMVKYYKWMSNAVEAVLSFTPDSYNSSSKSSVNSLLTNAHDHIVKMMAKAPATQIFDRNGYKPEDSLIHVLMQQINGLVAGVGSIEEDYNDANAPVYKVAADSDTFYIIYDKETKEFITATTSRPTTSDLATAAATTSSLFGGRGFEAASYDSCNKKATLNLAKYIPVNLATVDYIGTWEAGANGSGSYKSGTDTLRLAVEDALEATVKDASGVAFNADVLTGTTDVIDGTVDTAKEWGVVYRNLQYALYDTSYGKALPKYTKAQLGALIDKSYECDEACEDTNFFESVNHKDHESTHGGLEQIKPLRENAISIYKDFNGYTQQQVNTAYRLLNEEINRFESIIADLPVKLDTALELLAKSYQVEDEATYAIPENFDSKRQDLVKALVNDKAIYNDMGEINHLLYLNRASKAANPKYPLYVVDVYNVLSEGFDSSILSTDLEARSPSGAYTDVPEGIDNFNTFTYKIYDAYTMLSLAVEALEEAAPANLGDANGDGAITAADATAILKHVAEIAVLEGEALKAADFNEDGSVTAADATAILKSLIA